jgi:hypothetical protein
MCKELRFDAAESLIQKVAGERHVDPLEEEEAHLLGEPWKPRRHLRHRHSWVDDQIEQGTGI